MTPAELRCEAKLRGILDEDDVAWFVENGAEVMLFEEALRSTESERLKDFKLKPGEFVVEGEPDHARGWGTVLLWKPGYKELFEVWPRSALRRELLAAKAERHAQQREEQPERKGALSRRTEPDPNQPCWVLKSLGMTKGSAEHMGGFKVILEEYECVSGRWRRKKTPQERPTSLYQALEKADWWGRLPNMGRKRRAFNDANLNSAVPLFAAGLSQREVARRLKLGRGTVAALYQVWQAGKVA